MSLGERLREERERLGLSQPKFGELLGTTKQTVFAWETGRTAPDGLQLGVIAAAGADVLYIVTGQRGAPLAPPPLKPDEAALLDNYRHSPEDQQRLLRETGAAFAKQRQGKRSA